jgi:hypothetical protein
MKPTKDMPMASAGPESVGRQGRSDVSLLIEQLNFLLNELLGASRASGDPVQLIQIANEMSAIQTLINQAAQAQAAADDAVFAQATASLKTQSSMLQDMETHIAAIVADVARVGRIVGYIAQGLVLIGKL